jgi:hypothetical protein
VGGRSRESGPLYYRILRGRNVSDAWSRAAHGRTAAVSVLESGLTPTPPAPAVRLAVLDIRSGALLTVARGRIHRLAVSPDGCCVSYLRESRGNPGEPVAPYFDLAQRANNAEAYAAVNWGTERHVLDAHSGVELDASPPAPPPRPSPTIDPAPSPPRSDARQLSISPRRPGRAESLSYVALTPDSRNTDAFPALELDTLTDGRRVIRGVSISQKGLEERLIFFEVDPSAATYRTYRPEDAPDVGPRELARHRAEATRRKIRIRCNCPQDPCNGSWTATVTTYDPVFVALTETTADGSWLKVSISETKCRLQDAGTGHCWAANPQFPWHSLVSSGVWIC